MLFAQAYGRYLNVYHAAWLQSLRTRLQNTIMAGTRRMRLLSLDGGGIRGLSSLIILKHILAGYAKEKGLTELPKPHEIFDLAGGTSTGGLIVIMLFRLKLSIDDAIDAYNNLAQTVFSDTKWFFKAGYFKATRLEQAILRVIRDKLEIQNDAQARGLLLIDPDENSPKCFVCALSTRDISSPILFRSWPTEPPRFPNITIIQAARATSAAPTYFKSIDLSFGGVTETFIDGGIYVNNPTNLVLGEARTFPESNIDCILSLGTGVQPAIEVQSDNNSHIFKRVITKFRFAKALAKLATDSEAVHKNVRTQYRPDVYFRLSVLADGGLGKVSLSEWTRMGEVEAKTIQYLGLEPVRQEIIKLVGRLSEPRHIPDPMSP